MLVSKDIYEYIMKYVNGKTLVSMTSVNKKYNKEKYFQDICKNLPFEKSYKYTFLKYKEFIEYMRIKKYTIERWANPENALFSDTLYRSRQYETDNRHHCIQFAGKCVGCQWCHSYYGEIAHDFLIFLTRRGASDVLLEKYFHLQEVNLLGHHNNGICSKLYPNRCNENKMFKIPEEIIKSFTV